MDELDAKIFAMLKEDGRASNAGIARRVGVSEGTVRRRLKRLVDDDYIQVVALLNPGKAGFSAEALIGVQVDPEKVDEVSRAVSSLEEVSWVAITTGAYDIFAWATLESSESLGLFLRTKLGTIRGVRRTETFVSLSVEKRGYGLAVS